MQFPDSRILIFAKAPRPGYAKTRLIPALGEAGAASLYADMLRKTVEMTAASKLCPLQCWCAPDLNHPLFDYFANDCDVSLFVQQGDDLGQRMSSAALKALDQAASVLLIGGDCPSLGMEQIMQALRWLEEGDDAVLGPAEDGGYVLLGLRRHAAALFSDIPWGTDQVLSLTRKRLTALEWRWRELPEMWDVDRPQDLHRLFSTPGYPVPSAE